MGHNSPSELAYDEVADFGFTLELLLNIGTGSPLANVVAGEGAAAEGAVGEGAAGEGAAGAGVAGEGAAGEGTAGEGAAGEGAAGEGTAGEGTAGEGAAREGAAGEGAAREGAAREGAAREGAASKGAAAKRHSLSELLRRWRYGRYLAEAIRRWTDTTPVDRSLRRLSGICNFDYYRLNVQGALHDINMDEWNRDGTTLQEIEHLTTQYLEGSQEVLANIAEQLVNARINREGANTAWTPEKIAVLTHTYTVALLL